MARTLDTQKDEINEEEMKILSKYIEKIPDVPPKYVINEGLTKMVSKYYNGKLNTFPLYKISFKIDRKPVKIPWTLGTPNNFNETKPGKKYTYVKVEKPDEAVKS